METRYTFQFPEVVLWQSDFDQAWKVREEAAEAVGAIMDKDAPIHEYVDELLDAIQAAETALRHMDKGLVDERKAAVIEKNRRRGYYG